MRENNKPGSTSSRPCVICGKKFTYGNRPGRPPSFCSDECKAQSKRSNKRICIICKKSWSAPDMPGSSSPFYCSTKCSEIKRTCRYCDEPVSSNDFAYCTVAHMVKDNPGPYKCRRCDKEFAASDYYLRKDAALGGPPSWCSSECYANRWSPSDGTMTWTRQATAEWTMAYQGWKQNAISDPPLPTRSGIAYVGVDPTLVPEPDTNPKEFKFNPAKANAINFWRHVLDEGFFVEQSAEQLYYSMCYQPAAFLPRAVELFPWIQDHIDHREFRERRFIEMNRIHVQAQRMHAKSQGAMNKQRMTELLQQAWDHFLIWQNIRQVPQEQRQAAERWIAKWLKPSLAAFSKTRLELEATRYMNTQVVDSQLLERLWGVSYNKLDVDNEVIKKFFKDTMDKSKTLPWGEDLRSRINAVPQSRFDELLYMARGGYFTADQDAQARVNDADGYRDRTWNHDITDSTARVQVPAPHGEGGRSRP